MQATTPNAGATPVHPSVESALSQLLEAATSDAGVKPPIPKRAPKVEPALTAEDAEAATVRGE